MQKIGNEHRLFSLLNFPCTAILNFYDVKGLPLLLRSNVLFFETVRHPFDVIEIQSGGAQEIKKRK